MVRVLIKKYNPRADIELYLSPISHPEFYKKKFKDTPLEEFFANLDPNGIELREVVVDRQPRTPVTPLTPYQSANESYLFGSSVPLRRRRGSY